jgi:hypothetical protein
LSDFLEARLSQDRRAFFFGRETMPMTLHAAFVPTALQIVRAVRAFTEKAQAHCGSSGLADDDVFATRIIEDMFPLPFQYYSVYHHSAGALDGVRAGVFGPPAGDPPKSFAAAIALMDKAEATLEGASEDEMEGWFGQPMRFEMREFKLPFTADQFLLTFSQPNYMFHASTAYDILRMRGVPLGKRDFMGQLRLAGAPA